MARPHIEPFCDRDNHFKPMRLLGFGTGMHYKMLSMDTDTGACSMTVQFDGGYKRTPGFSWSEYELIVIEGGGPNLPQGPLLLCACRLCPTGDQLGAGLPRALYVQHRRTEP